MCVIIQNSKCNAFVIEIKRNTKKRVLAEKVNWVSICCLACQNLVISTIFRPTEKNPEKVKQSFFCMPVAMKYLFVRLVRF